MSYDANDRLTQILIKNHSSGTTIRQETFAYNAFGEVSSHMQGTETTTYTYDDLGLLTEENKPGYLAKYWYDANGNRTKRERTIGTNPLQTDIYTYDQGDKLLNIARNGAAWRTYAYNGLGETTSITEGSNVTTFNWNNDGRVTRMDLPGTTNDPAYAYNGMGTRVSRTVGSSTVGWKRSGAGVTASVLNDGTATFTPGISSRVGTTSTFTHAGLKNTTAQSETTALSATRTYDAFGLDVSSTGTWKTAVGYAGAFGYQETDAGMKLLGHRYYDPETGRFLSRDPIKDGRNWYAYGAGDWGPTTIVDPTGLAAMVWGVAGGFAIADGPLPIGDAIALGIIAGYGLYEGGRVLGGWINSGLSDGTIILPGHVLNDGKANRGNRDEGEHVSNIRPSTEPKHQKGKSRRKRDRRGGEKGDARRPYLIADKMELERPFPEHPSSGDEPTSTLPFHGGIVTHYYREY